MMTLSPRTLSIRCFVPRPPAHQDAHDRAFNAVEERFGRIEHYLERTEANMAVFSEGLQALSEGLRVLGEKFNGLIDALTRKHRPATS